MLNRFNRALLTCFAVVAGLAAHAESDLYIENFSVKSGNTYNLPICINTYEQRLYGFQCDLTLPEGATPQQEDGSIIVNFTDRCLSDHAIVAKYVSSNTIRFIAYNNYNKPFNGTNGAVLTLPLTIDAEPGTYQLKLSKCSVGLRPEHIFIEQECADYTATMTVLPGRQWTLNQLYAEDVSVGEGSYAVLELGYYSDSDVYEYKVDVELPEGVSVTSVTFQPVVADVANFTNKRSVTGNTLEISGEYGGGRHDVPAEGGEKIFAIVELDTSSLEAGDYDITLSNQFLSTDVTDYTPANYTAKLTVMGPIRIGDGAGYTNTTDIEHADIIYTRNFPKATWQALYLPYALAYEEWADKGDMAQLNNVHQYDTDGDGHLDTTTLEFERVTEGSITPNVPYVFRPFAAGETVFTSRDRTLVAAPLTDGSVDCSSTSLTYTIYGTYTTKEGLYTLGAYALNNDGVFAKAKNEAQTLKPFRIYLLVTEKNSYGAPAMLPQMVNVSVDGEATVIEGLTVAPDGFGTVYDLQGRPVVNPGEGIFIINGKKTYLK